MIQDYDIPKKLQIYQNTTGEKELNRYKATIKKTIKEKHKLASNVNHMIET